MTVTLPWRIAAEVGCTWALARGWWPLSPLGTPWSDAERGIYAVLGAQGDTLTVTELVASFAVPNRAEDPDPAEHWVSTLPDVRTVAAVLLRLADKGRVQHLVVSPELTGRLWWMT